MFNLFPLADFGSEVGPLVACIGVFLVPIVWILTSHQRKMAELIHGNQSRRPVLQNEGLETEVRDLKQIVYQQSIAIDAISTKLDQISNTDVQSRMSRIEH
jgi:hypothetical protein